MSSDSIDASGESPHQMELDQSPLISNFKKSDVRAHMDNYADLIVEYLHQLDIGHVFGVPGGAIEPLFNALARSEREGGPKIIVARHEAAAAFMADGYFRETGKMGVVCATTGPGATNLLTGVSSAYVDKIPMMVITAQTALPKFGRAALQDSSCSSVDTVQMFRHCTEFTTLVSHPEQMENKMVSAIMAAHRPPFGPVHISIPSDILAAPVARPINKHLHADLFIQNFTMSDESAIDTFNKKLAKVDTVSVLIGKGTHQSSARIVEFCELTNSPFVVSPTAKAWIDETHPLYRGVYGYAGHDSAERLFKEFRSDLILAIGVSLDELNTCGWTHDILNTRLIHVDSTMEHFTRSPMANLHVCGSIKAIFTRLVIAVKEARKWGREWNVGVKTTPDTNIYGGGVVINESHKCLEDSAPVKPQRLMYQLSKNLPEKTRVYVDAGNSWAWTTHYFNRTDTMGEFQMGMGFGAMAWSLGASIGASIGGGHKPTVCITGDGSFLMSSHEITVAAQHRLPVVFVVLNDAALGMVMHGQRMGGAESIGWELNKINYAMMAEAMGIHSMRIEDSRQLEDIDWAATFENGPCLIDVVIDREEKPPMGKRIKNLSPNMPITLGA